MTRRSTVFAPRGVRIGVSCAALAAVAVGAVASYRIVRPAEKTVTTGIARAVPAADGLSISVSYLAGQGGGCSDPLGVVAAESSAQVVLTARVRFTASRDGEVCPLGGLLRSDVVRLGSPLGSRTLVDGHDGRRLVGTGPGAGQLQ